jgi:ribonuclease P protein component
MLPKENRLSGKNNFEKVKKDGLVYQSETFAIIVLERQDGGVSRVGFIVSNKISKKATDRNKVKRNLRNIISPQLKNIKPNFDLIFLAKRAIIYKNHDQLNIEVGKMLKKTNLLK